MAVATILTRVLGHNNNQYYKQNSILLCLFDSIQEAEECAYPTIIPAAEGLPQHRYVP